MKRITRNETITKVNNYVNYAKTVNIHTKPVKGTNCGAHGSAFEQSVKLALGNYRFDGVAGAGKTDTTKKINGVITKIEIKSGCGELATLDADGNITSTCLTSNIIIYAPEYNPDYDCTKQSYVIDTDMFFDLIKNCGLLRLKKSSAMCRKPENEQYADKMAIQTFKNSMKKTNMLYDALEAYGIRLDKWIANNL